MLSRACWRSIQLLNTVDMDGTLIVGQLRCRLCISFLSLFLCTIKLRIFALFSFFFLLSFLHCADISVVILMRRRTVTWQNSFSRSTSPVYSFSRYLYLKRGNIAQNVLFACAASLRLISAFASPSPEHCQPPHTLSFVLSYPRFSRTISALLHLQQAACARRGRVTRMAGVTSVRVDVGDEC